MSLFFSPYPHVEIMFGGYPESFVPATYKNVADTLLLQQPAFASIQHQLHAQRLVFAHQTHGIQGMFVDQTVVPAFTHEADFLITQTLHTAVAVATADCVSLALYDTNHPTVGVIHAGWRGTIANIAGKAIQAFLHYTQGSVETVRVVIGPAARSCCYEISPDFVQSLSPACLPFVLAYNRRLFFDTVACNISFLAQAGIAKTAITDLELCTIHMSGYCSYRASGGKPERQYCVASLK